MNHDEVLTRIENGTLFKGQLRINGKKRMDAYVVSDSLDDDIYISGQISRNRALDGDIVAVRLLDIDEVWEQKTERERIFREKWNQQKQEEQPSDSQKSEISDDTAIPVATLANDDIGTEQIQDNENEEDSDKKPRYAGEVVYILDRQNEKMFTGVLSVERPGSVAKSEMDKPFTPPTGQVWMKATDKRTPLILINPKKEERPDLFSQPEIYGNVLVEVKIIRWPITSLQPLGRIKRLLGSVGDLTVEEQAILADNGIMDLPFDKLVLDYLESIPRSIPTSEYENRRDLREELVFTIDPVDAKDLDDALHIKRQDDGCFEVGVHIADVSYYVKQNTLLDAEAKKRGTTTYLVDRSIPMLPTPLCEELCSLNPMVDKLTFSVIWKLDREGNVQHTWFGRTVIRSCAKLAYEDAQHVIDHGNLPDKTIIGIFNKNEVEEGIQDLYKLSAFMRKRRYDTGALSLNSVKLSFTLDINKVPTAVHVFESKEANKLIEEFMLLANISVAQKILQAYPTTALLRCHEPPIERRLLRFLDTTRKLGYDFDVGSAAGLQASFDSMDESDVKDVLLVLAIQPMKRAKYICSGAIAIEKYLHYALDEDAYTHFTSPIRRYADVIVHRLLHAALLGKENCGYNKKMIQQIVLQCNRKKDGAKNAQDTDIMLYLTHYLLNLKQAGQPLIEKATVTGVEKNRFDIYVHKYGLEYCVHTGGLPLQRDPVFNKEEQSLELYWKPETQVTADYFEKSRDRKWEMDDDEDDDDDDLSQMTETLANTEISKKEKDDLPRQTQPTLLDSAQYMQTITILSTLDVNIIPETTQTPPRIHILPINPF
ncbi:uncharacterized protein BX664DRAFT_132093 [Halteromyces radiatus]|uniref:uncharacterized protein n=1 Tax=Halteromyces radiatus TaxID=101107 RepID=UPI0022208BE4|nr:uncharacterized protein BX664DRAFT_132093 [Halteromyces radiatus]KAI8089331.1 hypothetical protein BX664DRAFT_132093 [Halteromyces radiatus]